MNTDQYIHQYITEHGKDIQPSFLEKAATWIYKHPTVVKTLEIAAIFFALAIIVTLPYTLPILGVKAVVLAVGAGIIGMISLMAFQVLDILIPPHHSMKDHIFEPATYQKGRLYYQGDIPILELHSNDPYQAGFAHGYLLGKPLDNMLFRLDWMKKLTQMPQAEQVPETVKQIHQMIPSEYIEEMRGVVEGFNQWSKEKKWFNARTLTVEDLILFHIMPDSLHFFPKQHEARLNGKANPSNLSKSEPKIAFGCSVVIDKDDEEGIVFGRNMDWPSIGPSIIINRKYKNVDPDKEKFSTIEVSFPGFVGTLTGMNKAGLSLAMNVCSGSTEYIQGMPAAFFNRYCLEKCYDMEEVEQLLRDESPLGSYHLSVADKEDGAAFHFYQGSDPDDPHVSRERPTQEPLITTNCQYPSETDENGNMHCSVERKQIILDLFNGAQKNIAADQIKRAKLVEASLGLPFVDNRITTHKVVMYPESKRMRLAFDNAFAGQAELQELDTEPLFS